MKSRALYIGSAVLAVLALVLLLNGASNPGVVVVGGQPSASSGITAANAATSSYTPATTTTAPLPAGLASDTQPIVWQYSTGTVDAASYDAKLLSLANLPIITKFIKVSSTLPGSSTVVFHTITVTSTAKTGWPVTTAPYPNTGAVLPFHRIVAYYGNLYSTQMGILGEYPSAQVLAMLASTTAQWTAADPSTPAIPALDYIVVAAQASSGADGKYRLRMPDSQVQKVLQMAQQVNGLVFLDIQVGLSNVETEVPLLEKYLELPNVELSLDPEFDMHNGAAPGTVIGTMDASDINWASNYLAGIVRAHNLPPKILVIHRFTYDMVTNTRKIQPLPEVQVVMDMDGFGFPAKKINTYQQVIVPYPVQFTGFKLFYKNDAKGPQGHVMTPAEVLKLSPQPSYIQYQ